MNTSCEISSERVEWPRRKRVGGVGLRLREASEQRGNTSFLFGEILPESRARLSCICHVRSKREGRHRGEGVGLVPAHSVVASLGESAGRCRANLAHIRQSRPDSQRGRVGTAAKVSEGCGCVCAKSDYPLGGIPTPRWGRISGCYVTNFGLHKALKLLARGRMTFDERVVLHRGGWGGTAAKASEGCGCVLHVPCSLNIGTLTWCFTQGGSGR